MFTSCFGYVFKEEVLQEKVCLFQARSEMVRLCNRKASLLDREKEGIRCL